MGVRPMRFQKNTLRPRGKRVNSADLARKDCDRQANRTIHLPSMCRKTDATCQETYLLGHSVPGGTKNCRLSPRGGKTSIEQKRVHGEFSTLMECFAEGGPSRSPISRPPRKIQQFDALGPGKLELRRVGRLIHCDARKQDRGAVPKEVHY